MLTDWITARIQFPAPVRVYPGEDEMAALARGGLRVLRAGVKIEILVFKIGLAAVAAFPLAFSVFPSLWELANRQQSEIPGSFACGRPPWNTGWNNVQPLMDAARSHRELPGISRRPCRVR